MKNNKKICIILLLLTILFVSCYDNIEERELKDVYQGKHVECLEIDSCEYILVNGTGWFSHKGNCKFCKQRNKK